MWFGTPNGIDKFDGKNFINYNYLFQDTLSGNYQITYDIIEDNEGTLWIATFSNGIILFNKDQETITRLRHDVNNPSGLGDDKVLDLFKDQDDNIWVATAGAGLELYNKESKSFIHFRHDPENPNSIGSDYISSITADSKGNLWILSVDGIVSKYDRKTQLFENTLLPLQSHTVTLRRGLSHTIFVDSDDNVFVGSYFGLFIINAQTGHIKHITKLNPNYKVSFAVTSITEIQKNIIALATSFQGLYLYNTITGEYTNYSNSINANYYLNNTAVTCIYKSYNGLVWLGSYHAGVNMYNKEFSQFQLLADIIKSGKELFAGTRGTAFCSTPDHKIWIAIGNNNILTYDPETKIAQTILKQICQSYITSLSNNNNGEILIGTEDDGLLIYDYVKKSIKKLTYSPNNPNSISSNYVLGAKQDKDGNVWINFSGTGLDVWNRNTNQITHYKHDSNNPTSLLSNIIHRLIEDRKGRIWIGTPNGLCYFDKGKKNFIRYPLYINKKNNVQSNSILDIFEDSKNNLWIGTDRAIFKISAIDSTCQLIKPQNEEPYLITNIMEDRNHDIWMTSFNKLFRITTTNNDFSVYNFYNGSITPSFFGYSSLSANGQFYLGSLDRIITFDPATIVNDTLKPHIYITKFEINNLPVRYDSEGILNKHINFTQSIQLDYKHSTFSFWFSALEYSYPEKIQYAYKLENFDDDWITSNNLNTRATYTKIPPGKYIFRVKATNRDGKWSESDQRITIEITPPFWNTTAFKILSFIFILFIIYSFYLIRSKQLRLQKEKLEKKVKQRTTELNEANTSLGKQNVLLNQMSHQILKQNQELERHYNELEILVDERTEELKAAKNKAEESDRLKSAFLTNMSHEIRTPMNAIVGFSTLLNEKNLTETEKDEYIKNINTNCESLLILIDDILDLSMIEANQMDLKIDTFDVNEFMDHLYSAYSMLNSNENIKILLNNELHNQHIQIKSDRVRIRQVLTNLLSNAFKFTNMGTIEIGLKKKDNTLAFYIKDTGIGIPAKDIETIFERFRKLEDNKKILYRGTGLGLAISKSLARILGGNLSVESTVQKGSVFTLSLPDTIISNEKISKPIHPIFFEKEFTTGKKILIVEDESANYMYIKSILSKTNISISHAENGLIALEKIESGDNYHLILMDIKMPVMDGFEATQIIKSRNPNQHIVAITAYARPEEKNRFMEAGFDDYLAKPVKPNELRAIINKYL